MYTFHAYPSVDKSSPSKNFGLAPSVFSFQHKFKKEKKKSKNVCFLIFALNMKKLLFLSTASFHANESGRTCT